MAITVTRTAPLAAPGNPSAATGSVAGDLTNGTTYYYRICATTSTGFGRRGIASTEVSAVADANGSIDLSWDAVSGASAYVIFRTPNSGDYSLDYRTSGGAANLDPDESMMCLRNANLYYTNCYTTTGTTFTDKGSTTTNPKQNASTQYTYYQNWMNQEFYENGRGLISLAGGTSGDEASFDDIYADAVANGYDTTHFIRRYGANDSYRIYECIDDLELRDYFTDYDFTLIYHDQVDAANNTNPKIFGKQHDGDNTYGDSQFILHSAVGRQVYGQIAFSDATLYGVRLIRDYGIAFAENTGKAPSGSYSPSANVYFGARCTVRNVLIDNGCQQVFLGGDYQTWDTVDIFRNTRGINISSAQDNSVFNKVRVYNNVYDTTGNYSTTLKNSSLYNTSFVHRFFGTNDKTRTLLDCLFPNGTGLPASASNGGGAVRNVVELKWSFDMLVTDDNGTPINGASVQLIDNQGNVTNLTTGADGKITTQELTQATYNRATEDDGNFDTTVDYNPYQITVSASGKRNFQGNFDLETTTSLTAIMSDGDTVIYGATIYGSTIY